MQIVVTVLKKFWRVIRWPLLVIVVCYVGGVIYFLIKIPKDETRALETINSAKLSMKDVDGSNLPPAPDPKFVDATVEGIDANHNNIRDDVELAIFKKYPNDAKVRAAALQYAMTEQFFLLDGIRNHETWKAAAEQSARAFDCLLSADKTLAFSISKSIQSLVFNVKVRTETRERAYKFITSYGSASGNACDI